MITGYPWTDVRPVSPVQKDEQATSDLIPYATHGAGIFTNICLKKSPSFVGKYTIHGAYGYYSYTWLVVSTPLKHMTSSVGMMIYSQLNGKIKHVPKHQPDTVCLQLSYVYHYVYYLDVYRSPQKFHMLDVPLKGPRQSQLPLFVTENSPGLRKQPAPQQGQSAMAMGSS